MDVIGETDGESEGEGDDGEGDVSAIVRVTARHQPVVVVRCT